MPTTIVKAATLALHASFVSLFILSKLGKKPFLVLSIREGGVVSHEQVLGVLYGNRTVLNECDVDNRL